MGTKDYKNLDVSFIIVNFNQFELLDKCLSSIHAYSIEVSYEVIVVDNASTGNVEAVTSKFSNVILIRNDKNIGFAAANNKGLERARGEFILFLNNDTEFIENSLKPIIDFYNETNKHLFIGCKLLNTGSSPQESVYCFENIFNSIGENFFLYKIFPKSKLFNRFYLNHHIISEPTEVDVVKGAFIFCRRGDIEKLNGFDPNFFFYAEETDLCYRFKKDGGKIIYFPMTKVIHHGGASSGNLSWFKFKNQSIAKIQFFQKHYSGLKFFLLVSFHLLGIALRIPLYLVGGLFGFKRDLIIKSYYYLKQMFVYPKNVFKIKSDISK